MNFEQREKQKLLDELDTKLAENPLNSSARAEWINVQNSNYRLWVVEFESMNYAGAASHCLVWAFDEDDARDEASDYAEDWYFQEDGTQYLEENEDDDGVIWSTITSTVLLEGSDFAEYVEDDHQQRAYYQIVN